PTPQRLPSAPVQHERTRLRPAPSQSPRRWRVSFDSGGSFVVEGLALVGRRPEPRASEPVRHVVPLPSSDMSLSKTHAQFQVAPDGALVVMDRGSTNGSFIIRRGMSKVLTPGRPTTLLAGDVVQFGDRSMNVERVDE
ncbi:MAG: FHA domain-containing protein, partial [Nocardioidaceae bacterium]|nr:FHA domain-containing protein [Nocardioidaceae bacterium]